MTNRPSTHKTILVAKRDGSVEPFTASKMLNCITNGLFASGETLALDSALARGLAEAVVEYLQTSYADRPVPSRHIAELTELVLSETGNAAAGAAIRRHAAHRERCRKRMLVAEYGPSGRHIVRRRWDKGLLVKHLRRRHRLELPVARLIAGRVEQIVFQCGLLVVTSAAVREIARSELIAWGLLNDAFRVRKSRSRHGRKRTNER